MWSKKRRRMMRKQTQETKKSVITGVDVVNATNRVSRKFRLFRANITYILGPNAGTNGPSKLEIPTTSSRVSQSSLLTVPTTSSAEVPSRILPNKKMDTHLLPKVSQASATAVSTTDNHMPSTDSELEKQLRTLLADLADSGVDHIRESILDAVRTNPPILEGLKSLMGPFDPSKNAPEVLSLILRLLAQLARSNSEDGKPSETNDASIQTGSLQQQRHLSQSQTQTSHHDNESHQSAFGSSQTSATSYSWYPAKQ